MIVSTLLKNKNRAAVLSRHALALPYHQKLNVSSFQARLPFFQGSSCSKRNFAARKIEMGDAMESLDDIIK